MLDRIAITRLVFLEVTKGNAYSKYSKFSPYSINDSPQIIKQADPKLAGVWLHIVVYPMNQESYRYGQI